MFGRRIALKDMDVKKHSIESAPKLKRVERRQLRNRKALLAAARKLIHEKGVDTATMQEITEIADVGVGTMYNYFRSKDDLIRQIVREDMNHLVEWTLESIDPSFDPVRQAGYNYWRFLQKLSKDPLWKHLLTRPGFFLETIYEALESTVPIRTILSSLNKRNVNIELSDSEYQLARWQSIGTLTALAMAVQNGRLDYSDSLLDMATRNVYRLFGLDEKHIEEVMKEFPPPARD